MTSDPGGLSLPEFPELHGLSAEDRAALLPMDDREVAYIRAVGDDPNPYPYSAMPAGYGLSPLGWRFMTKAGAEKIMRRGE